MRNRIAMILAAGSVLMVGTSTAIAGGEVWSYTGDTGPENWGNLSPGSAVCGNGHYQSPIDISGSISADLGSVNASIKPTTLSFGLDGPTFAVPYQPGSTLKINGTTYSLSQFHFHHQSEHTLNGKHFPMEAHFVMKSEGSDHNDAVMGVFIKEGKENAMLKQFWDQLPRSGQKDVKPVPVNAGDLLPKNTAYFMYEGSMTTPGCPQGVRWFVLENPAEASKAQINKFIEDFTAGDFNNRPVQPTYGRAILKGK